MFEQPASSGQLPATAQRSSPRAEVKEFLRPL